MLRPLLACRWCAVGYSSGRTRIEEYKGLVPNVLRVMPQSAITFLVYEKVMQLLDRHLHS